MRAALGIAPLTLEFLVLKLSLTGNSRFHPLLKLLDVSFILPSPPYICSPLSA